MANKSVVLPKYTKDKKLNFSIAKAIDVYKDDSKQHNRSVSTSNSMFGGLNIGRDRSKSPGPTRKKTRKRDKSNSSNRSSKFN